MTKKAAIELFGPSIPKKAYLACSGGVDSMFALSFLVNGRRDITLAFFDHGTPTSDDAFKFLTSYAAVEFGTDIVFDRIRTDKPDGKSQEEYWREERYKFLHSLDGPVVMAHHLDDCVETWLFGAIHGTPKTIPYQNKNVIRPFLLARKQYMIQWCNRQSVRWMEDESNRDLKYMRNRIRHEVVPSALGVNPGLHKVVARKVKEAGY